MRVIFMTIERPDAFDLVGTKTTLIGPELHVGDSAPDFTLLNRKLQPVTKTNILGKPTVISVVPSLDTPVCSIQTARFDKEAAALGDAVNIVTVSVDLPFAQARWTKENEAGHVQVLSDHRDMNFGNAYGTHVKDVRIESRAVFVLDAEGTIRHVEYVPAAGSEPDYDAALAALKSLL